jgi:hypothetical protein
MCRPQPGGDVEVIARATHRMRDAIHVPQDAADVFVDAFAIHR